ncbi:MAG: hypothetical protein EA365_08855 [Gloeocapsa sp. DLM2.Bin57]|nr:MAG: hypothetical protein EA365_08855 [Gloeocapsa sp. DLM2.Bin57]
MSGRKEQQVRINESELRRLRQQENQLKIVQQDLPKQLEQARESTRQEFQQRIAHIEQRSQHQQQNVKQMKSQLAQIEQQSQQRLNEQRQQFQSSLQAMEMKQKQQRQEYLQLIEQQTQNFSELLETEREARKIGERLLQEQIDEVVNNLEQQQALARDWIADVEQIWQSLQSDYDCERFAPGKLDILQQELNLARTNIKQGLAQAAISMVQRTYLELTDLRIELEQKERIWQLFYQAALEDLRSLITEVHGNREYVIEADTEGEALKFQVDYWTQGKLSEYQNQLEKLEKRLIDEEKTLTTEAVEAISNQIQTLEPRLAEILEEARLSILSSQVRAEIAERVAEVLEQLGYSLDTSGYENKDLRRNYAVKVKNISGDEVVTIISPAQEFGNNTVSINTFSNILIDESATQSNAQAIFSLLAQEGIEASGSMICEQNPLPVQDIETMINSVTPIAKQETELKQQRI